MIVGLPFLVVPDFPITRRLKISTCRYPFGLVSLSYLYKHEIVIAEGVRKLGRSRTGAYFLSQYFEDFKTERVHLHCFGSPSLSHSPRKDLVLDFSAFCPRIMFFSTCQTGRLSTASLLWFRSWAVPFESSLSTILLFSSLRRFGAC